MRIFSIFLLFFFTTVQAIAQCTLTNSSGCECLDASEVDCDLLPDITIEWDMAEAQNTEYAPGVESSEGRLRISGHTPNIGVGPLNLRGLDENGYRWMICNDANGIPDTFQVYDPTWSIQTYCPDGSDPKHIAFQRIYHKNADGTMTYWEKMINTFTYHPDHGHMHFDDWTILTLRVRDPNISHPEDWPIVGEGSKIGFCVMDLSNCVNDNCRDNPTEYGQGNILSSSDFPNYGLGGGSYGCDPISQGISSGYSDIYGEYLNGMWINIPVGTCNGEYAVVLKCGKGEMVESDTTNNYTWFPITLTEQTASPSASINASGSTMLCPGETVTLNANSNSGNPSYQWYDSNGPISGANSASLDVSQSGSYSVEVADPSFGTCSNSSSNYVDVELVPTPVDLNMAALVDAPLFEVQSTSGNYILCDNGSITLEVVSANTSSASYFWSNGHTGPTASIDTVGDYTVTVTDNSFPCPSTISNVISVSSVSTPVDLSMAALVDAPLFEVQSVNGNYQLCNNDSITLEVVNANTSSASYSWSNGHTGPTASVDAVGDYTVTVTDNSLPCPSTISNIINVSSPIASPQISSSMDTICLGDNVTLSSSSGLLTNWYSDAAGLNPLSNDSNYTASPFVTTTFYATSSVNGGSVGELEHSGTSDYSGSSYNGSITFNAILPITINTVDVFTNQDGVREIMLWDEDGNVVTSETINITSTNGGDDPTTINLNFSVPAGNNYVIGTNESVNNQNFGDNSPELKRQGAQYNGYTSYPYVIDNVVELTNSPYGIDYYYYFYNWDVTPVGCESPIVAYDVHVVNCATSLDEANKLTIDIYPNPTSDNISISGLEFGKYIITNVLGETMLTGEVSSTQKVVLSKLPKGVYNLIVTSLNGNTHVEKIVLQ